MRLNRKMYDKVLENLQRKFAERAIANITDDKDILVHLLTFFICFLGFTF